MTDESFQLTTIDEFGFESQIRSNGIKRCAKCKILITPDNDSGWEIFVSGHVTQPECIDCWNKDALVTSWPKADVDEEILQ